MTAPTLNSNYSLDLQDARQPAQGKERIQIESLVHRQDRIYHRLLGRLHEIVIFHLGFCKLDKELQGLLADMDLSIEGVWGYNVD
jgi:hypothetical protein